MTNISKTLYYIYKNRWQKAIYEDASRGWILLILYALAVIVLFQKESQYVIYFLLILIFVQTIGLHVDRRDYNLLSRFYPKNHLRLLLFLDNMLFNLPVLLVILLKNRLLFAVSIVFIFLLSLTKLSFNNKLVYLPLLNQDPLWKTYIRKYPFVLILFLVSYYVNLQGILNDNPNLSLSSYFAVPLVGLFINSERDKLIFIKQAKISERAFLWNILKANVFNTFIFFLPHILIGIFNLNFEPLGIFLSVAFISGITCIRYILFFNQVGFALISLALFGIIFSLSFNNEINGVLTMIGALLMIIFIFRLAEKAVKKLKLNL
jgi:hypothetical protein